MNLLKIVSILFFTLVVRAEDAPVLTGADFDEQVLDSATNTVKGDKPWFIKFYAPWCGHCKKLAPTWNALYESNKDNFNVIKVDCTLDENKGVCAQFGVRGFPSLVFLKGSDMYRYKGKRE